MRMRSSLQKTSYSIECYLEVGLIQHENPLILRDRPILIAKISSFPRTLFEWYLCLSFMCFYDLACHMIRKLSSENAPKHIQTIIFGS